MRQVVDQIRKDHKVGKTTEFVMEKLKEMGITEENFEGNKNILADIIQIVWYFHPTSLILLFYCEPLI